MGQRWNASVRRLDMTPVYEKVELDFTLDFKRPVFWASARHAVGIPVSVGERLILIEERTSTPFTATVADVVNELGDRMGLVLLRDLEPTKLT